MSFFPHKIKENIYTSLLPTIIFNALNNSLTRTMHLQFITLPPLVIDIFFISHSLGIYFLPKYIQRIYDIKERKGQNRVKR
jgi:hypothetical protein